MPTKIKQNSINAEARRKLRYLERMATTNNKQQTTKVGLRVRPAMLVALKTGIWTGMVENVLYFLNEEQNEPVEPIVTYFCYCIL